MLGKPNLNLKLSHVRLTTLNLTCSSVRLWTYDGVIIQTMEPAVIESEDGEVFEVVQDETGEYYQLEA